MSAKTEKRYIFGSILRQLVQKLLDIGGFGIIEFIESLRRYHRDDTDLELATAFIVAIPQLSFNSEVYIVIDGIDECPNRPALCEDILRITRGHGAGKVKVLVTSRSERDIGEALQSQNHVAFTKELSRQDIAIHIDVMFEGDPKLKKIHKDLKTEMKEKLLSKSDGVFRWVYCAINVIGSKRQDSARRAALNNIPSGLDETYVRDLDKLKNRNGDAYDFDIGMRALTWLLYCHRPLRLSHLATAAAISPDCAFDEDQRLEAENIFDVCRSLIDVNLDTDVVEFSHISVREFLLSPKLSNGSENPYYRSVAEGNALLMGGCFMYLASPLLFSPVSNVPTQPDDIQPDGFLAQLRETFRDQFTFYAVYEWPAHAQRLDSSEFAPYSVEFLTGDSFPAWCELWELKDIRNYRWWEEECSESQGLSETIACELRRSRARVKAGSPLYYATTLGLQSVVHQLLSRGHDPNEFGGPDAYPLFAALENANAELADLLISNGANINIKDQSTNDTALHRAIAQKNKAVIKFLLDRNADHTVCNKLGKPPLHLAVDLDGVGETWFSEIIELLAHVDVNVTDKRGKTAVHFAAKVGCRESISLLIQQGADVDITDHDGRTALHVASSLGKIEIADILLRNHANIGIADDVGFTALHLAVQAGSVGIVQKILQLAESGHRLDLRFSDHQLSRTV